MKKRRRAGTLQRMGGKEERTSRVGQARADVERSELKGEPRFDIASGPGPSELLRNHGRPKDPTRIPRRRVSKKPRGGPEGPEPEDVKRPARRRPGPLSRETLPFEHDDLEP